jgi:CO/xanthine dehydrogenase Mo-binding subunit
MLAEALGMDPLALRRKNILRPGDVLTTRVKMDQSALSLPECLDLMETARERMKQVPPDAGKTSGVGCALAIQSMGLGAKVLDESANRLEWLPDGKVLVHLGAPDLGQGLMTVTEQMVAEALGLDYSDIVTAPLDTWKVPNGGATCGSRMTYLVGKSVLKAAELLQQELLKHAALMLGVDRRELSYRNGRVFRQNGEGYPVSEFTARLAETGEVIQAEARAEFEYPPEITPQHLPIGMPHIKFSFAGQVIRVEVDQATGMVEVKEVEAIHDLGRVINRTLAEGQIEGGIVMGIGYALYEDMPLKADGNWVSSFAEYLLPSALDVPQDIRLHLLEIPEETGPYGAKGIAEISLVPTAPAIANAVHDACGRRVKHLPITAEKVLLGE